MYVLRPWWRFPLIRVASSRQPVILMYHGVPPESDDRSVDARSFEAHIRFLKSHFEIIHPNTIADGRKALDRVRVLITVDDGLRNSAEVVAPILRKHNIPAIFFVSSRHANPGKYLWFSYLRALENHFPGNGFRFRGEFIDLEGERRHNSMRRLRERLLNLRPHPAALYEAIDQELPRLEDFISPREL